MEPLFHKELIAIWNTISANQTPAEVVGSIEMMTPVINIDKLTYFLDWSTLYTPEAFQAASTLVERLLSAKDSTTLKS